MNTEERLTRARHDEAGRVDPDVEWMNAATLRRLTEPGVRRTCDCRCHYWSAVAVAGAAGRLGRDLQHHWQKTVDPGEQPRRARPHQQGRRRLDYLYLPGTDHGR